jgi:hypothetical protein
VTNGMATHNNLDFLLLFERLTSYALPNAISFKSGYSQIPKPAAMQHFHIKMHLK